MSAFLFALLLGLEMITAISDYRNMVNDMLCVKGSVGGGSGLYLELENVVESSFTVGGKTYSLSHRNIWNNGVETCLISVSAN